MSNLIPLNMTPLENIHYAIGELAYAFAKVDGKVDREERNKFEQIIKSSYIKNKIDYDVSKIIFQILDKDKRDAQTVYNWAIHELQINSHYLSPELKECTKKIMKSIAEAYPPVTKEENELYQKFVKDIEPLKGDPVYYKPS